MVKKLLWAASAVVLVAALVIVGGGWYFADQIRDGTLKVDHSKRPPDLEVANMTESYLTLKVLPDTKTKDWQTEGIWGVDWEGGWAQVGKIIELKDQSVIREYVPMTGGPKAGDKVRLNAFAFTGDPLQAHGITFKEVNYNSDLGNFPAWYIEGSGDIWAIFVHGINVDRREALRVLPVMMAQNLPSLVITYRNDEGAPSNPDGQHWFGLTEWKDLEGAVRYADENGAKGVILVGYSMGGAIVMNFLYESPLAEKVKGVVLDSPMLDLGAVVTHGANQRRMPVIGTPIPGAIIWTAKTLSSIRFGMDYDKLNYLSRTDKLEAPILLFHGDGDKTVPIALSDTLARARRDLVRYVRRPAIDHVRTWNVLRNDYEGAVRDFITEVAR